jgi:hypothetical protein
MICRCPAPGHQPLQVAVHYEDQVIEPFAWEASVMGQRFRFVHLPPFRNAQTFPSVESLFAIFEIADKTRLVDRLDRSQPHGNRGELQNSGISQG